MCLWYFTVLSLATLLWCLKHRTLLQAQLRVQRPECRLRVLRGNWETLVEPRQELLQHPVGFPDAAGAGQHGVEAGQVPSGGDAAARRMHGRFIACRYRHPTDAVLHDTGDGIVDR